MCLTGVTYVSSAYIESTACARSNLTLRKLYIGTHSGVGEGRHWAMPPPLSLIIISLFDKGR